MDAFAKELHSSITHLVEGEPLCIVMGSTNGLETWRLLSNRYLAQSALITLLNLKKCKTFTELAEAMLELAELVRECDRMSTQHLVVYIKAATLVKYLPYEVKENTDLGNTKGGLKSRMASSVAFIARRKERAPQSP